MSPSELMGRKIDFLLEHDDALSRAFTGEGESGKGADSSLQVIGRRKQGPPACFDVSFARWRADDRVFVTTIWRDVTERMAAEDALARERKSSSRVAGGIAATGVDLRSRRRIAITSIRNGRPIPAPPCSNISDGAGSRPFIESDRENWWPRGSLRWRRRRHSMSMHACNARTALTAGSRLRSIPVRAPDGTITRWFGTATDITDLIEARDALRRSNEELEALVGERTREREVALRQLHESQKMETHRPADRRRGARLQQSARRHPRQPVASEKAPAGRPADFAPAGRRDAGRGTRRDADQAVAGLCAPPGAQARGGRDAEAHSRDAGFSAAIGRTQHLDQGRHICPTCNPSRSTPTSSSSR